jgi:malonyl-CoA/methylmalonyl-CoA synthetase
MAVPTIYSKLIDVVNKTCSPVEKTAVRRGMSTALRLMVSGSAALPIPVLKEFEKISGHVLLERYGMTEVGMALSQPYLPVAERLPGTVGAPLPTVEADVIATVRDEAESSVVGTSPSSPSSSQQEKQSHLPSGRLVLASASLFDRYWRNSTSTIAELYVCPQTGKRYFETGDTVAMDAARNFTILGRTSVDIIKRSGYKLSALEIEAALLASSTVRLAEVAVFGVPHASLGEAVVAVVSLPPEFLLSSGVAANDSGESGVVARSDGTVELRSAAAEDLLSSLKAAAAEKLAPYKRPAVFIIMKSIPRNAMGKVNKKDLKKRLFP